MMCPIANKNPHLTLLTNILYVINIKSRLPPEVNRILYVRNLPFRITADELYDIFGKYGAVFQIRLGEKSRDTRGTAFVGEFIIY